MGFKEALHRLTGREPGLRDPLLAHLRFSTKNLEKLVKKNSDHIALFGGIELLAGVLTRLGKVTHGEIRFDKGSRSMFVNGFDEKSPNKARIQIRPEENFHFALHGHNGRLGDSTLDGIQMFVADPKARVTVVRSGRNPLTNTSLTATILASWGRMICDDPAVGKQLAAFRKVSKGAR